MSKLEQLVCGMVATVFVFAGMLFTAGQPVANSHWMTDVPKQEDQRLNKLAARLNVLEAKWNDRENHFELEDNSKDFSARNSDGDEIVAIDQYGIMSNVSTPDTGCVLYNNNNRLMVKFANGDIYTVAGGY